MLTLPSQFISPSQAAGLGRIGKQVFVLLIAAHTYDIAHPPKLPGTTYTWQNCENTEVKGKATRPLEFINDKIISIFFFFFYQISDFFLIGFFLHITGVIYK